MCILYVCAIITTQIDNFYMQYLYLITNEKVLAIHIIDNYVQCA